MSKAAFKKLSYQERQNIPKGKFLFIDANGKPHLPVQDAAHIRNAISRLGSPKTGRKWGLSATKRASLQARARSMLDRASHSATGPHLTRTDELAMDVAKFSLKSGPVRETDDMVYRPATVFRAGEYPDKNFSLSPAELKAAAAKFDKPIDVDLEHIETPLDGHLGKLVAVKPSQDGTRLHGMLAIPRWLHEILPQAKLSATWDRSSKRLVGLAMVRHPRVSDAALFAAFSVDQVARGKRPVTALFNGMDDDDDDDDKKGGKNKNPFLNMLKKKKAKAAAKGDKKKAKANLKPFKKAKKKKAKFDGYDGMMAKGGWASQSGGSRDGVGDDGKKSRKYALGKGPYSGKKPGSKVAFAQMVHDITARRGVQPHNEPQPATGAPGPYGIVRFQGKSTGALQAIHDTSLAMGANCSPTLYGQRDLAGAGPFQWPYPGVKDYGYAQIVKGGMTQPHFSKGGNRKMGKKSRARFAGLLAELDGQDGVRTPASFAYAGPKNGSQVRIQSDSERVLAEQNARLQEENRQLVVQGIYERAATFADKAIEDGHALPVEREALISLHLQAGNDDTFVGTATFSEGNNRVNMFEQYILGRPKNLLDVEVAAETLRNASAVFNRMHTSVTPTGASSSERMDPSRRDYLLRMATEGSQTGHNLARPAPSSTNGTSRN